MILHFTGLNINETWQARSAGHVLMFIGYGLRTRTVYCTSPPCCTNRSLPLSIICENHAKHSDCPYLGIVMHFVFTSWVVIAFSRSSNPPVFLSFFTKLFTAFSDHFSSLSLSPFFQPSNRFTIGGVNGNIDVVIFGPRTQSTLTLRTISQSVEKPSRYSHEQSLERKNSQNIRLRATARRHFPRRQPDRSLSCMRQSDHCTSKI